ncbi:DUF3558 family protein [Nocardia otitidiscaviarum]|uniref:DUF3558 family protein n=1 Tax=Nocardia otitidiscaviarum TaxID=1823 RepID=UPI002B4B6023|nr:DUF3558 family protein [Nocardia otitidiscaviarum]
MFAAGCAQPQELGYSKRFASLPSSCADVSAAVEDSLRGYAGDIYAPRDLHTLDYSVGDSWQRLACTITYDDDPIPDGDGMPAAGPMSRTVTVDLRLTGFGSLPGSTTTALATEWRRPSDAGPPTPLPGVGEDAITWTSEPGDRVRAHVLARIGNLKIEVVTDGRDWTGDERFPLADTHRLRTALRSGGEAITAALAHYLPDQLPQVSTPQTRPSPTTYSSPPPQLTHFDPCAIPDTALAPVGLTSHPSRNCVWNGGARYDVEVELSDQAFADVIYRSERYAHPVPVTVNGRRALQVYWASDSRWFCDLAFDTPRGDDQGRIVGTTVLAAVANATRNPISRDTLCDELLRVAAAFEPHLPPGRSMR